MLIFCARCSTKIEKQAALLFGPPDPWDKTEKTHLCGGCYDEIIYLILEGETDGNL